MKELLNAILRNMINSDKVFRIPLLAATVSLFVVILSKSEEISKEISSISDKQIILIISLTVVFVTAMLIRYLSENSIDTKQLRNEKYLFYELSKRVKELQSQRDILSKDEKHKIIDSLLVRVKSEASESIYNELRDEIRKNEFQGQIDEISRQTLNRIYSERMSLNKRGTVNLVIGVITAFVGILLLSYFAIIAESSSSSITEFVSKFMPRLSIVVLVEVFSFFFLRLYKSMLTEIKYFQNEATNLELTFAGLKAAMYMKDQGLITKAVERLLYVEKNPILTNNQTTKELEEAKIFTTEIAQSPKILLELISALIKTKDGSKSDK